MHETSAQGIQYLQNGIDVFFTHWRNGENEPGILLEELRGAGVRVEGMELDLSLSGSPERLLNEVAERLGPPSILVNNAARSTGDGYEALDAATLDAHYAVNLRATALLSVVFARRFVGETGGRIVNLTSGQSLGPMPGELAYVATKGAIEAFTRTLAAEVGHKGITVNAVNPGPTNTGWMTYQLKRELSAKFSAGRVGEPEDAARLVAFLASDDAAWITGQIIHAEGGFLRSQNGSSNLAEDVYFTVPVMITGKKLAALWRRTEPRGAKRDELRGYVRGQLYPHPILYALLALFGVSEMLSVDWFGLLLLNSDGVVRQMIIFNALHVTVVVLGGVAITSVLPVAHYKRLYIYTAEENGFFTLAFLLSFPLGGPCALAGVFAQDSDRVRVSRIYYLVLMVRDMEETCGFYSRVLKVAVEEFEGGRLT